MKLLYLCLAILFFLSCSPFSESDDEPRNDSRNLQNSKATFLYNSISENADAEVTEDYAMAINGFSVDLLGEIYKQNEFKNKNIIVSPYSVSRVLSVIAEGTVNESRDELLEVLGGQSALDDTKSALQEILYGDSSVIFQSADALFYNTGTCSVKADFRERIIGKYGVEIKGEDFSDQLKTADAINDWTKINTAGYIEKIIESEQILSGSMSYILNAIYFKADWESPFDITKTRKGDFHSPEGIVSADMMSSNMKHEITKNSYYENARIYYGSDDKQYFYLDIYMPVDMTLEYFIEEHVEAALGDVKDYNYGDLTMPKFIFESDIELTSVLSNMGVNGIFDRNKGDITGILNVNDNSNMFFNNVFQKAYMETDEEGTKAAAVTIAGIKKSSSHSLTSMTVNRPFVYFIRAGHQGLVIFAGVVNNP